MTTKTITLTIDADSLYETHLALRDRKRMLLAEQRTATRPELLYIIERQLGRVNTALALVEDAVLSV